MKRQEFSRAIAGLAGGLILVGLTAPAVGWDWNPFKNNKDKVAAKYREPGQPTIEGRPLWAPVSKKYRWNPAETKPSPVRRVFDVVTLKPLRTRSQDQATTAYTNGWPGKPPVANTSNHKSLFGSMFKPKPPKKVGPQTMAEWMNQERPKF